MEDQSGVERLSWHEKSPLSAKNGEDRRFFQSNFTYAELNDLGFFNGSSCGLRQNDLTYPIHPLFDRNNFKEPQKFWDSIIETLRLASAILESPASIAFIYLLMNDRRQKLEEDSKRLSAELYRFGDLSRQKHGMRDNVNQRLKQVENSITFRLFDQDSIDEQPETYAYVMINRNLEAIELGPSGWDPGYPSDVFLGTGAILQINKQKERIARIIRSSKRKILKTEKYERHLSRLLRLQLVLAITLCHEMMHVISNGMMPPSSNSTVEPYYCDDRLNELGFAYENCVFGGTVQDLEFRGCKRPLTITKWPAFDSADVNTSIYELRKPRRFATMYFISMQFVSNVQQQAFWDRRCATHDTILLQIPRTIGWRAKYLEEGDPNWASQDSSNMRLSVNTLGQVFRMKSA